MTVPAGNNDAVFGHYMLQGSAWSPALAQSSQLFQHIVSDNVRAIEEEVQRNAGCVHNFYILLYWPGDAEQQDADTAQDNPQPGKATVTVKQRTMLMLAAYHGSLRILSFILSRGTEPSLKSPDGLSAYEFAVSGGSQNASTVLAMLKDAEGTYAVSPTSSTFDPVVSAPPTGPRGSMPPASGAFSDSMDMPVGVQEFENDPFNPETLPYSTAELTRPEYSTDIFRMFCFKVLRCSKRYAHDWRACPFAHPTENARRRDPREFKYCSTSCPDYKQGFCIRGDTCPYAHGVFESWLHPSRYRTQLCKDGLHCRRPVCFFAHALSELRTPTYTWVPTAELGQATQKTRQGQVDSMHVSATAQDVQAGMLARSGQAQDLLRDPTGSSNGQHTPSASGSQSPDILLKPIRTHTLMGGGDLNDYNNSPDSPLDLPHGHPSTLTHQALMDLASSSISHDLLQRLKASSPDTPTSAHLIHKMLPMDAHLGSPSLVGSPMPGSPTASIGYQSSSMMGAIAAPRMSNAFARKYGLNPRDNPVVNLQKIALAGQVVPSVLPYDAPAPHMPKARGMGKRFPQMHLPQPQMQQQQHQQYFQQAYRQPAYSMPQQYMSADPSMLPMYTQQQLAVGAPTMHPGGWQ